ncbi:MAG TPA: hypothetical protein VI756_05590 [Blastocatellia bacterium]
MRGWLAVTLTGLICSAGLPIGARADKKITPRQSSAGQLDPTFDTGGIVTAFFGAATFGNSVVQQSDGKLVIAGLSLQLSASDEALGGTEVQRYNADGTVDTSFGNLGTVTFGPAAGFGISTMALQSNGQIVLLGSDASDTDFELIRLNTDGSIDGTFGGIGQVITSFGVPAVGLALAIQPDGDIIAGGGAGNFAALARYNPDGSLDSTFGTNGLVQFQNSSALVLSLALQANGQIIVGGISGAGIFFLFNFLGVIQGAQFMVARLNSNGTLDTQFATGGVSLLSIGAGAMVSQVALQSNGQIVAGGISEQTNGVLDFALARYNTDGSLDTAFGSAGEVVANFDGQSDAIFGLAIQPDGKLVAAGASLVPFSSDVLFPAVSPASTKLKPNNLSFVFMFGIANGQIALARFNTDGSLDSTFGSSGVVETSYNQGAAAFACLIESDGKIVVAGTGDLQGDAVMILARYSSGVLIPAFSVSVSQTSQTVAAGSTANYTVGVQTATGLTPPSGAVSLSASISPSSATGISATFNPTSVSVGGTSTLAVATSASTPNGAYTITISATAGGVTETTTATLMVTGPGFSLGLADSSITAEPGTKVPVTITINRTGGLTGDVTVTAPQSLPTGVVVKGSDKKTTTGNSVTFTLKVKSAAAAGSDQLIFTGTDASGQTASTTLTLVVQ